MESPEARLPGLLTGPEGRLAGSVESLDEPAPRRPPRWRIRLASIELLAIVVLLAVVLRSSLIHLFSAPRPATFVTVFASVTVAGLPFLVLGAAASAALAAFVPYGLLDRLRALPAPAAVPAAVGSGLVAPLGDDGPDAAAGLLRRSPRDSVAAAVAVTFLLASAAINPVVLVGTAVAFPGEPTMVLARLVAGMAASALIGWLWLWLGRPEWLSLAPPRPRGISRGWPLFWERCRLDVVRAGGFLVLGALVVAVLTVVAPPQWLDTIAGTGLFAAVAMALLAVLLSVRGGADAFVAAAMSQFSSTARLAFLVVGPMANLRLFTRQVATFGPRFAVRVGSATLAVSLGCALIVGAVLL